MGFLLSLNIQKKKKNEACTEPPASLEHLQAPGKQSTVLLACLV